ncbi:unnamed protein product [Cuscuta europaea]|uniref:SHSP domain-containing protein n=2 Tax=Cuscuta europaea TaxID=41803 RepID=A0A9P1EIQ0_CUSEU|nr:unnamed protein product [Cuscuta europaea]
MGSNEQKLLDLKKQFEELKTQFEKCKATHRDEKDGQHIIEFPLPPGTKKEQIKLTSVSNESIRIEWTPQGVTEPFKRIVSSLQNYDHNKITAHFVEGVLRVFLQPKIPPPAAAIVQDPPRPDVNNREAPKTAQSPHTSDQNDDTAKRGVETESGAGGSGGLEDGATKRKSIGEEEESRHTGIPAAAAATMRTEVAAATYYEVAKNLISTHQREILNVAVGLAILGMSMYLIPSRRRRHD